MQGSCPYIVVGGTCEALFGLWTTISNTSTLRTCKKISANRLKFNFNFLQNTLIAFFRMKISNQSMGSERVGHGLSSHTHTHTPVAYAPGSHHAPHICRPGGLTCRRPAHLREPKLAVAAPEAAGRGAGGETLAVRAQPVHVSVKNVAAHLPDRVVHCISIRRRGQR